MDILKFKNEVVSSAEFEEIELNENVILVENCGNSGLQLGCNWWNIEFKNGTSMDIYTKKEEF